MVRRCAIAKHLDLIGQPIVVRSGDAATETGQ